MRYGKLLEFNPFKLISPHGRKAVGISYGEVPAHDIFSRNDYRLMTPTTTNISRPKCPGATGRLSDLQAKSGKGHLLSRTHFGYTVTYEGDWT